LVLFSFRRVRIRSPVQPVVEPINIPLLRYEPLPGLDQEVRPEWNPYEFPRFVAERRAWKPFPTSEKRTIGVFLDPDRRNNLIEIEPRRTLQPRLQKVVG